MPQRYRAIGYALLAAALFGASTPLAKMLGARVAPLALAGMLYLGSGIGLLACFMLRGILRRDPADRPAPLARRDWPALAGAIAAGGVAGPVLLMAGLRMTAASSASASSRSIRRATATMPPRWRPISRRNASLSPRPTAATSSASSVRVSAASRGAA